MEEGTPLIRPADAVPVAAAKPSWAMRLAGVALLTVVLVVSVFLFSSQQPRAHVTPSALQFATTSTEVDTAVTACTDTRPKSGVTLNYFTNTAGGTKGSSCPISCSGGSSNPNYASNSIFPASGETCLSWPGSSSQNSGKSFIKSADGSSFSYNQWWALYIIYLSV